MNAARRSLSSAARARPASGLVAAAAGPARVAAAGPCRLAPTRGSAPANAVARVAVLPTVVPGHANGFGLPGNGMYGKVFVASGTVDAQSNGCERNTSRSNDKPNAIALPMTMLSTTFHGRKSERSVKPSAAYSGGRPGPSATQSLTPRA